MRGKQVTAIHCREIYRWRFSSSVLVLFVLVLLQACATVRPSRPTLPPAASPPQVSSLARTPEPESKPVVEQGRIREEDLKEKRSVPQSRSKDRPTRPAPTKEAPPPVADDSSLIAKITPRTSPQRAASLRLTEEGRRLIESGDYAKALGRLEKTISIDSTNPYGYYYLAQTHFYLGRYQESLNFLDVAESLLANEPFWLAEVFALKGENFRALGFLQKADSSYSQALRLNSGNRLAAEGLTSLKGENQPSSY
ncbi:tetratricopeptide repeat protein [bacterium]|nr:MAG: tetratricopeptide repeat protein [bacterium]